MKKSYLIYLLAFSFLTTSITANAQSDNESRESITFGLKVGGNYSNVWDERGEEFRADGKVGFAGGVFLGIPIGKYLGVQPEILISQKGFKGSGTLLGTPYSFKRTTTFIDVPLFLQFKPAEFVTIVAGPQYSFLANQKDVFTFGSNSIEQEEEFNNENIRRNILGFALGLDFNIYHFVVSARASVDFQSNHSDGSSSTPRYKNQLLQLTVGYRFYK